MLGKKGELTQLLRRMGALPADQRKVVGEKVNQLKPEVEAAFAERLGAIERAAREADLNAAPLRHHASRARAPAPRGHLHPLTQVRERRSRRRFAISASSLRHGPEVELEEYNFTKLGFPPDHPATDMQDTLLDPARRSFFARTPATSRSARCSRTSRRSRWSAPGAVYRKDDDVTHSPMFHQVEGFLVDEGVTLRPAEGRARRRSPSASTGRRRRSAFARATSPSSSRAPRSTSAASSARRPTERAPGCRICKFTGWIEILGCGMIHPVVFEHTGIDPERYTGFAFGMGIERVAMLRYDIPDVRLLFENDPRLLGPVLIVGARRRSCTTRSAQRARPRR